MLSVIHHRQNVSILLQSRQILDMKMVVCTAVLAVSEQTMENYVKPYASGCLPSWLLNMLATVPRARGGLNMSLFM
jgi:hypothetical protein